MKRRYERASGAGCNPSDNLKIIRRRNCDVRKRKKCGSANEERKQDGGYYVLPTAPSSFRACHHFPFLSIISKISPLENEISLGSSGDAVSMVHRQIKSECETVLTRTCIQRFCPVWVRCVRGHAGISRQRGSTTCTDARIAWGAHQGRVDPLWAACVCSETALRWYRAGRGTDRSVALL